MQLPSIFDHNAEKALASDLAAHLVKNISPTTMVERRHTLSASRITRILEQVYERAANYRTQNKPGFLRRTVLTNNFRWEMESAGYPKDFIDVAVEGFVVAMTKQPKKP
ncbi:hypothetical protein WKW80_07300 [Variovorax humicola]|uniref:Uncharacterized protein n=1 Tax=Variovorax humicola TaxID=1769758 RepID=A0ABU8VVK7_9BURK